MLQATNGGVRRPALCHTVWSLPRLRSSSGSGGQTHTPWWQTDLCWAEEMDGGLLVKQSHDVPVAPFLFRIIIIINYRLINNKLLL